LERISRFSNLNRICRTNKLFIQALRLYGIFRETAIVTYKEWSAYRSHALVSVFVGPVAFAVQYFIWHSIFAVKDTVNGLTLQQMLTYYAISSVLYYITFDFADWNLQMLIHSGKFLTFMLRPVSHRFFALSQKAGHRLLGFWVEFLPVYLIFLLVFRVRVIPEKTLWAVVSILLSFLMTFLTNYCIGITAFWLTRTGGLRMMFNLMKDIFAGSFIPLIFFPEGFQKVLFFLHFQYITYVPTRVFIGSYQLAGMSISIPGIVGIQALAVLLMWLISEILWRIAINRFSGVGA
jgi:ABC-2 type transport system permease protein